MTGPSWARRASKRAADLVASAILLVVLSPVFLACCLAIKVESRGPVFFRSRRIGWHGRPLNVLKFRKMRDGVTGAPLTGSDDERFTRIGRLLARTKLDELPQLWLVLRGKMSLVGPRPESAEFTSLYRDEYGEILSVRPGVTGLCQLAFAKESDILDDTDPVSAYVDRLLPQKVRLDLLYVRSHSLRRDFRILLWTVLPVILRVDVAVNRATGELTVRRRRGTSGSTFER